MCDICRETGERLKGRVDDSVSLYMGMVADVQQRAATCPNCQTMSELIQAVSTRATEAVTLEYCESQKASALWLGNPSISGARTIHYFIRNDKRDQYGVSVGKNTSETLLVDTLFSCQDRS